MKIQAGYGRSRALADHAVFDHRKTVAGRQRQHEMVAVKGFQSGLSIRQCSDDAPGSNVRGDDATQDISIVKTKRLLARRA
ncbi:hypothetical protein HNO84_13155 [Herbaspirillum robiniae]|uniref:Resolvase/invertase-type recombinase catalytic domain-containing protein n=1 Tax=Herbaspirillum robiniae TaxID=2014887 RepID=A0ABX2LXW4_9BURK|nr:hypothetical protein [Herbaspirillum robiniae]